jgi:hypothetical protein
MGFKVGKNAKVTLGTNTVVGMGNWSLDGITVEMLDSTAFGDEWRQFLMGVGDYGTLSFGGWWDMSDTTGQVMIDSAHKNKSKLIDIRFYVDNTSYYIPNTNVTSSGGTDGAGVLIQTIKIAYDKAGIGTIEFTGKCTGPMILM